MYKYNDNELLYLVHEGCDIAAGILIDKYVPLIKKRLGLFKINHCNYERFFQEGCLMCVKAISTYNLHRGKSFNRYFDLILQRHFKTLLERERPYFYDSVDLDEGLLKEEAAPYWLNPKELGLNDLEAEVYYLRFHRQLRPAEIAQFLELPVKKVYNVIYAIKNKAKRMWA